MISKLHKATVFLIGLTSNIIITILVIAELIICIINYNYININWARINIFKTLPELEISTCILYVFSCVLGFIVFIKSLECKTMQKIYFLYTLIVFIFSFVTLIFCFLSTPNKSNSGNGILENFEKCDQIFIDISETLCSTDCPCDESTKINFQQCPDNIKGKIFNDFLSNDDNKNIFKYFNQKKFISYWNRIEKKFVCTGWNFNNITNFLFTDVNTNINENKENCNNKLSRWLNIMILLFGSLLVVILAITIFCLYVDFCIYYDKVYEGSNFPTEPEKASDLVGVIGGKIESQVGIVKGTKNAKKNEQLGLSSSKDNSLKETKPSKNDSKVKN